MPITDVPSLINEMILVADFCSQSLDVPNTASAFNHMAESTTVGSAPSAQLPVSSSDAGASNPILSDLDLDCISYWLNGGPSNSDISSII